MTKLYNRKTKSYIETEQYGNNALIKLYRNKFLLSIATCKFVSDIYGLFTRTRASKFMIKKFIKANNIDMTRFKNEKYNSFNAFFIRNLKKIDIDKNSNNFISPCDSKLTAYKIKDNLKVNIKGLEYTIDELFDHENLDKYKNGYMMVFRLSVDDYHRFCYTDNGNKIKRKTIKGKYHTVSSPSSKYKIYKENHREYTIMNTENFGEIIYMEVGALLIGKIVNYDLDRFKRGEEKGYFLPGGSTIVLIVNNIKVDTDILKNSKKNIETIVHIGEKIGIKTK